MGPILLRNFFIYLFVFGSIQTLFTATALAQAPTETILETQAINIAERLEIIANRSSETIVGNFGIPNSLVTEKRRLRRNILNGFDSSHDISFLDDISDYKKLSLSSGDLEEVALAGFYEKLADVYNPYNLEGSIGIEGTLEHLRLDLDNPNWMISHSANIISSILNSYDRNFPVALEMARESFEVIPEQDNFNTQFARYYSSATTTYLHSALKNADLYISSLNELIEYSEKIGADIEVANDLNNLIFSLKGFNINPDVMRQLVDILLRVGEKHPSDTPGLVEMRAANALIRIGDFEAALPIARKGLAASENEMILNYLKIAEIQSLAATGNVEAAEAELEAFKTALASLEIDTSFADNEIFKAKGLIAMARGDAGETFKNMDRHAELSIQRLLRSNNTDTSNLLANLENDKARQAEREAAREEMYRLEQEALTQRVNATQRGLMIMIMLALAALLLAAFMTYRSRTAIKLAQSAEAALAGEQAKSQFLAVISHELRTPLNGIIGIADLLSRTAPTDDLRRKISIINDSGMDLLKLVEQILDMSRIDANELEVFPESTDIREIVAGVDMLWRPTIENKNVAFTSFVDGSVPAFVSVDPLRLRQCVNNLVSNAAKFTQQGRVHLHVTAAPDESGKAAQLTFIVADTGMGIRPDVQANLFRPFVQADSSITRQYGGSGLGLAITRSLARMMGGDLVVTSRQGAGSEFTLTITAGQVNDTELLDEVEGLFSAFEEPTELVITSAVAAPITAANIASHADKPRSGTGNALALARQNELDADMANDGSTQDMASEDTDLDLSAGDIDIARTSPKVAASTLASQTPNFDLLDGVRVLIVEDIQSNQDVMKIFLEPEGCEIMCAYNGLEALNALKAQDFDVVLMDIRMPEMDGIEATRLIRGNMSRNTHVPIIALTADATAETNAQSMAAGANIFLTKPIIATELFDSIRFVRRQAHNRLEAEQVKNVAAKTTARLRA